MAKKETKNTTAKFAGSIFDFSGAADAVIKKKISAKIVCGGNVKSLPDGPLFAVIGIAKDTQTGSTDFGDWTALKGEFVAVNAKGEKFKARKCFLPDVALEPIVDALTDVESVEFGFDIFKTKDDTVQCGYTYGVKPLLKPSENDPLEDLTRQVPMLPAPEKES